MSAGKSLLSARSWQWPIDSGKRRDFCRKRESQILISHLSMWISVRILGLCSYISNLMIKHVHFLPCICKCQVSHWPWHMAVFSFLSTVHRKHIMKLLRKQRRPHIPPTTTTHKKEVGSWKGKETGMLVERNINLVYII